MHDVTIDPADNLAARQMHCGARKTVGFSSIALVVDKRKWAFDSIARHIKALIECDYDVSIDLIYAEDYTNETRFMKALCSKRYDIVHFFWRAYLKNTVEHYVSTNKGQELERGLLRSAVSFSIPEGLFTDADDVFDFSPIFALADGYCTVSRRLYDLYCEQILLPKPHCVLYDRTDLIVALTNRPRCDVRPQRDTLNVLWAGNSDWGRWLGLDDPKGARIIAAAVDKARNAGCPIHYTELDAAKRAVSQKEVGDAMLAADVYLCASGDQEGTPLPVIEAMAAGCAVATTDVGVAREIFPPSQHELIVARDADAFASILLRCAENTAWVAKVGKDNRATIRDWCLKPLHHDWVRFFVDIHDRSQLDGRCDEKESILRNLGPSGHGARLSSLRSLARRSPTAMALAKQVYPYALPILRKLSSAESKKHRLRRLSNFRNGLLSRADSAPASSIAVYTPMWFGVAASTRALFERTMPLPFFPHQHPTEVTSEELDEYVEIMKTLAPQRLVLSGAERLHWDFLQRYKASRPETPTEIISHSGQLQFTEDHHRHEFMMWLPAYHAGMIDKIWVLKRGLDVVLRSQGIQSEAIENYLPQKSRVPRRLRGDGPIRVGIWSVDNGWRKNLISQFLAFAGDKSVAIHHTNTDPTINSLLGAFGVPNVRVNDGPLPHTQLLSWLAKMDINLYATLSECSPMLPLESISLGVPVVVGPTTSFFDDDPLLRQRLVASSPEDCGCIRATVDGVRSDYDAVAKAIIQLGLKRETMLAETRKRLNGGVTTPKSYG
jgi:glycosyltransferase involved in cell wall biosynthesis